MKFGRNRVINDNVRVSTKWDERIDGQAKTMEVRQP